MELTSLLKEVRKKKGFTQMEVGNAIGITAGAYSKIETGVNYLSIDHIKPLCDFLEIPTDLLVNAFYGEGGQMMVNICDKENGNMLAKKLRTDKKQLLVTVTIKSMTT